MRFRPSIEDIKSMIVNTEKDIKAEESNLKILKESVQYHQTKMWKHQQILEQLKKQLKLERQITQNALENECLRNKEGESL